MRSLVLLSCAHQLWLHFQTLSQSLPQCSASNITLSAKKNFRAFFQLVTTAAFLCIPLADTQSLVCLHAALISTCDSDGEDAAKQMTFGKAQK